MCSLGSGNCLGEAGVEALRESLEAKGMLEYLGSLSDDEGTDSEGEGEDQEEEEEEREEGEDGEREEEEEEEREDGEREDGEREDGEREEVTSTVEHVTEEPQRTAISPPAEQVSLCVLCHACGYCEYLVLSHSANEATNVAAHICPRLPRCAHCMTPANSLSM